MLSIANCFADTTSPEPWARRRHRRHRICRISKEMKISLRLSFRSSPSNSGRHGEADRAIRDIPSCPCRRLHERHAPLAGTRIFWDDLKSGELAANLRLRDLDGARRSPIEVGRMKPAVIVGFIRTDIPPSRWRRVGAKGSSSRRLDAQHRQVRHSESGPVVLHCVGQNLKCFLWSREEVCGDAHYQAGSESLGSAVSRQRPSNLADQDRERYFDPVSRRCMTRSGARRWNGSTRI